MFFFPHHTTIGGKYTATCTNAKAPSSSWVCEFVCEFIWAQTDRQRLIKSCCQESLKSWEIRWQHLQKTTEEFIQIEAWILLKKKKKKQEEKKTQSTLSESHRQPESSSWQSTVYGQTVKIPSYLNDKIGCLMTHMSFLICHPYG